MTHNNSKQEFIKAQKIIPGGVNSPVRAYKSVGGTPPFIKKAKGAYIYDIDDNKYIDFVQSWGPLIFGHSDEESINAITQELKNGLSYGAPTIIETKLAEAILRIYDDMQQIRFVSSGTEAVMSAIRLARGYTSREDIIKFEGCYHGHSDSLLVKAGSGAATFGSPSSLGVPKDFTKHTLLATYNDIESVKKCFENSSNIACIIIEPIAGNMGLVPADIEFLKELKYLCEKNGSLLIFDEVMSGFRANLKGAGYLSGVKPDIITLGKVIGGGMPVGAFTSSCEIMSKLSPNGDVYQAGTLSGNPIAMASGLSVIERLANDPSIYDKLEQKAKKLTQGMKLLADQFNIPLQVDVRGSMFGFFFNDKKVNNFTDALNSDTSKFADFHTNMLELGVYFACSQFETGFISTSISDEHIDEVLVCVKKVFESFS